jgi:flagellar basal body-associated protein FliL
MAVSDIIQTFIALSTLIGIFFALKRFKTDNQESNQKMVEHAIMMAVDDTKQKAEVDKRLSLLEQKVERNDTETQKEIREIKQIASEIFDRLNTHINEHISSN